MKTLTTITAIITMAIMFSQNLNVSPVTFNEKSYINDISFSTTEIYNEIITENQLTNFTLEEEQYIDDIPFNTKCISVNCLYQKAIAVEFNLVDEQYIDDIEL